MSDAAVRVVGHRDADHVLEGAGAKLPDAIGADATGVRCQDDLRAAQHQHSRRLGKLAVVADHQADPNRVLRWLEIRDRKLHPGVELGFEAEIAGVYLRVGQDRVPCRSITVAALRGPAGRPLEVGDARSPFSARAPARGNGRRTVPSPRLRELVLLARLGEVVPPGVADLPHLREERYVGAEPSRFATSSFAFAQRPLGIRAGAAKLEQGDGEWLIPNGRA